MVALISDLIASLALPVPVPIFGDLGFIIVAMVFILIAFWFGLEKVTRWIELTKANDQKKQNRNDDNNNRNRK
jgi:uncharacterized protein YacL